MAGPAGVFISTYERQLDAKRRLVVPQDFRAALGSGGFEGVYCFPAIEADCLEAGGQALFDRYRALIDELAVGDPLRASLETSVLGGMTRLAFDSAGRITLPEALADAHGLSDWVAMTGLGDRFQIWPRHAFAVHRAAMRAASREGLAALRAAQRGGS
jgi:MraZ protein